MKKRTFPLYLILHSQTLIAFPCCVLLEFHLFSCFFCTIVSILGFIVKIKNPNFICSCVLVDPMEDYWITNLYARGTQDLLFMVLMVMGSLLGFRAISPLLKIFKICSINATEKSYYIFLAFIRFSIRLSGNVFAHVRQIKYLK
ncbi:hypothetical protein Hanom_Chr16g01421071 [Helianthus anomalus]